MIPKEAGDLVGPVPRNAQGALNPRKLDNQSTLGSRKSTQARVV